MLKPRSSMDFTSRAGRRKKMTRFIHNVRIMGLPLLAGILLAGAAHAADEVTIPTGKLQGTSNAEHTVRIFKGIPFAAPPVGDLRWKAPQPAKAWSGVRPAVEFGHDCMQLPFPGDAAPLRATPSEDCLYLNVWAPRQSSHPLPVMVWIYGGGFVNGGSSPDVYSGAAFARDGVVFVSFNYRLGRFGFFAF